MEILCCMNTDKILPGNMVIRDPISFTKLLLILFKKLNGRIRHLCLVSVRKSRQGYCRLMCCKPLFVQIVL